MSTTLTTITTTARLLAPLTQDLYRNAKGKIQTSLFKWSEASLPKKIAKKIHNIELVKTLWSPEEEVSLLKFYHPARVFSVDKGRVKTVTSVSDLRSGNIVIQGIVGQGKSIFLRYLAIQQVLTPEHMKLPVFLELRTLSHTLDLRTAIYKQLSSFDITVNDETFDYLAKSGKIILFLDGFDELPEEQIKGTINELTYLSQKYPPLQIIASSRPGNEIQKIPGFRIERIAPLTSHDYGPFLAKLGITGAKSAALRDAIKNSPSRLSGLINTPLMLTLIVIVYQVDKEIPPTLPEFFERLFQVVFTRHDRMKPGFERKRYSGLSERRLQNLFEAFCFVVLQYGFGRSLTAEQFNDAFGKAKEYSEDHTCEVESFRKDLTKVACLMLEEGIDITTFLHKSVLEYYAAAFIKHSTDEVASLFYSAVRADQQTWREVITFLRDIDPFRYSRDFALPEIQRVKDVFLSCILPNSNASLLAAIQRVLPHYQIDLSFSSSSGSMAFDLPPDDIGLLLDEFYELVTIAIENSIPSDPTKAELSQLLDIAEEDLAPDDSHPMYISEIAEKCGYQEFWAAYTEFLSIVTAAENEATSVIAFHERRKQLFLPSKAARLNRTSSG